MRLLITNPIRLGRQRATSPNLMEHPAWAISSGDAPLAHAAATIAPALTPGMQGIGMPWRSKTLKTPVCAMPRAKPPPRANPIRGGTIVSGGPIDTPQVIPACEAAIDTPESIGGIEAVGSRANYKAGGPMASCAACGVEKVDFRYRCSRDGLRVGDDSQNSVSPGSDVVFLTPR